MPNSITGTVFETVPTVRRRVYVVGSMGARAAGGNGVPYILGAELVLSWSTFVIRYESQRYRT
jgi:hypothetical protein